jgi:hypothetical protein
MKSLSAYCIVPLNGGNSGQSETPERGTSEEAHWTPAESEVYSGCGLINKCLRKKPSE